MQRAEERDLTTVNGINDKNGQNKEMQHLCIPSTCIVQRQCVISADLQSLFSAPVSIIAHLQSK